jgi:hypothetical protein
VMEAPMMPPPITMVSGEEEVMATYHRKAMAGQECRFRSFDTMKL